MSELVFVKLGGSVITDKTRPETVRRGALSRLADEIASALADRSRPAGTIEPGLRLVLGHGSGSFGHMVANRHRTRQGVQTAAGWRGFAQVASAAARLDRIVTDALLEVGVPAWSVQPSASARCRDGELLSLETHPVETALSHGLVPLVYGDVALDELMGGTIISTEQIFAYLARRLRPARLVLVGIVDGVYEADPLHDPSARLVPEISSANWSQVRDALGGSYGTDVTGGMLAKVEEMVRLVHELPELEIYFLSGERPGAVRMALSDRPETAGGTRLRL